MKKFRIICWIGMLSGLSAGCAATPAPPPGPMADALVFTPNAGPVIQAAASVSKDGMAEVMSLPDLVRLALERHPRLAEASWAIEAARGQALQAGLYPNPVLSINGNEISDRTGPAGIWSVFAGQEIVTGNKLRLSQAVAWRDVDQATLRVAVERFQVLTEVRQAYFEALTLQRRVEILRELVTLAEQAVENSRKLLEAKEAAELDVVQLEVDLERYRTDLEATARALPAAYRLLTAVAGAQDLTIGRLEGDLGAAVPTVDLEAARLLVLATHPELRVAEMAVERAQLVIVRAEAEPIPNVTVGAGYTYQGQNRSHDWDVGVSVPMPLWNRNQGAVLSARAQLSQAQAHVDQVRNELVHRLAGSFQAFVSAQRRSERYRSAILPKAQRTYDLSRQAYQGGQFEYLRVLEAQRGLAETRLELVRAQGEMWQAASVLAGLMLDESWPLPAPGTTSETQHP
ncbi:MAG TPA: TolC family protein [Gemmatales bacterium]|nr:TolC family protein [Gemmatales bacterium]HMP58302.1 TolC family protein [Gemmatales bacterium]